MYVSEDGVEHSFIDSALSFGFVEVSAYLIAFGGFIPGKHVARIVASRCLSSFTGVDNSSRWGRVSSSVPTSSIALFCGGGPTLLVTFVLVVTISVDRV